MRHYRDNNPRFISAKFPTRCEETGAPIKKGDECLYFPLTRKCYSLDTRAVEEFRSAEFDRIALGAEY